MGKVRKNVKYDGSSVGKCHYNDMHDKSVYEVYYPDGTTDQLTSNTIAENMQSKVDSKGHHHQA